MAEVDAVQAALDERHKEQERRFLEADRKYRDYLKRPVASGGSKQAHA